MRTIRGLCGAALILVLAVGTAVADESTNAPTITGETGYFSLFTGDTLPQGQWSMGFYFNNWDRVFQFADTEDLDWSRLSASFGYGLTDDFEFSVMVPYEQLSSSLPGGVLDESGLGNVRLGGKYSFWADEDRSFALNAFVELPTGDDAVLAGGTGYGAGLGWRNGGWVFNVGYHQPGDVGPGNDVEVSDEALAGIGYAGKVSDQFDWITELNGTFPLDTDTAIFDDSVDLVFGGRYWMAKEGPWAFNFGLRTDVLQLSQTDDHCPIGGLLGFTYFPRLITIPPPPPPPPAPVEYELTVSKAGDCDGTVTSSPGGVECGADCSQIFLEGTAVTLTAVPGPDCEFTSWTGDQDCADGSVTMNGDRACVANFVAVVPPPPPAPKKTEIERTCQFDAGSARVNNACKAILDEVALLMRDNPEAPALVIGYSDSQGSDSSNMEMSKRRAESVKNWLVTRHAVDPSRITVEPRGEAEPVGDNSTAAGRKQNRRAVIRITVTEEAM